MSSEEAKYFKDYIDACIRSEIEALTRQDVQLAELSQFEESYMQGVSGQQLLPQGVFRQFIRQMCNYKTWFVTTDMVSELISDVKTMKENVAELKGDVTELKSDVTTLKSDVMTLKSDVMTLKDNVASINSLLSNGYYETELNNIEISYGNDDYVHSGNVLRIDGSDYLTISKTGSLQDGYSQYEITSNSNEPPYNEGAFETSVTFYEIDMQSRRFVKLTLHITITDPAYTVPVGPGGEN